MNSTWYIVDNDWTHDDLPQAISREHTRPYAPISWHVTNSEWDSWAIPSPTRSHLTYPAPEIVWLFSDNRISSEVIPAESERGAFCNCPNLQTAHLPRSLKAIGEYAFRNTALTKVQISSDCTFHPTSFPDNCQIELFPDEESEQ
jgi:hypothetical protein